MITALTLELSDSVSCLSYSNSQTRWNQCEIPIILEKKEFWMSPQVDVIFFISWHSNQEERSFRFPVIKMDINACHPFCELPDVNGCTNEIHELVRLIMQEEELEFPSNATEAKNIFISIIRNIESRPHWFW